MAQMPFKLICHKQAFVMESLALPFFRSLAVFMTGQYETMNSIDYSRKWEKMIISISAQQQILSYIYCKTIYVSIPI